MLLPLRNALRRVSYLQSRNKTLLWRDARWLSSSSSGGELPEGASLLPLPALSPTMEKGVIASWNIEEQTEFEAGSVVCEVETDKATVDYEVVDDGFLARILVPAGKEEIEIGTPIAIITESEDVMKSLKDMDVSFLTNASTSSRSDTVEQNSDSNDNSNTSSGPSSGNALISPAAGFLIRSYGLDPSTLTASVHVPSGKNVITKGDVLSAIKGKEPLPVPAASETQTSQQQASSSSSPSPSPTTTTSGSPTSSSESGEIVNSITERNGNMEDVPLTTMRKVIASRLTEAKQASPHYYAAMDCEIDNILAFRKELKSRVGKAPSINDMIVKACSLSLRDVPRVNCRLDGSGNVVPNKDINVAVAVATPTGLITPIVRNTDQKGVMEISADVKDLAARAKENKLKLEEFEGSNGSFTVSNLGMFGISDFTAVINPPQSAILAVGGGRKEFNCDDEENPRPVNVLTVQISADRRLIDDCTASQFLQCFRTYMSEPVLMTI